jgi:predicted GIY-YIG superfamily endonuclease
VFVVYVLISKTTGKRYVGQTDNLARRLREHNYSLSDRTGSGEGWLLGKALSERH